MGHLDLLLPFLPKDFPSKIAIFIFNAPLFTLKSLPEVTCYLNTANHGQLTLTHVICRQLVPLRKFYNFVLNTMKLISRSYCNSSASVP